MQTIPSYSEEFYSTLTLKGQVTIPIEVRKQLNLKPKDTIAFVVKRNSAEVRRAKGVVERLKGIFKTNKPPLSAKELREAAEDAIAQSVIERSGM